MVSLNAHADSPLVTDVSSVIADKYVEALERLESAVVATPGRAERRRRHIRALMRDVVSELDGTSIAPFPASRADPVAGGLAFVEAGVPLQDTAIVITMLFDLAYAELCGTGVWPPERVAHELTRRILSDVAHIVASMQDLLTQTRETIDFDRLAQFLSEREIQVFDLIVANAPTQMIAAQLFISEQTVKHHITNIARKLRAKGRQGLLARARELGLLVAAPAVASGAMVAINSMI